MNVPSPTKQFDEYLPQVTQDLDRVTTHAASLPAKSDLAFHRTLDRKLAKELDEASERILALTRDLLELVDRKKNPKRRKMDDEDDVMEGYKRGVVDSIDSLLEDADSCLDEITGRRKKAAIEIKPAYVAAASVKLPGPWGSDKSTPPPPIVSNSYSAASWKVAKPQLNFPDAVDNSYERPQWTPTVPFKHHGMVPIGHRNLLDYIINPDPAEAKAQLRRAKRHIKHPYYYEMKHIPYPTSMFTASKPIPAKPLEESQATWVDTPQKLAEMTKELEMAKEIAMDLEHHDAHSYYGFTCLMQISTREKDWLVDTLALRGELRADKLGGVLADPSVIKVFHGSDSDITWLQKDFDLYVVNLFDTYHATKVLKMTSHGLANLLLKYCNYTTDKRYQLADWRIRPLTPEMQRYAQSDTHFLLYIYDNLRNALLEQSRPPSPAPEVVGSDSPAPSPDTNPQRAMRQVLELSAETALHTYERDQYDTDPSTPTGPFRSGFKKFFGDTPLESEYGYIYRRLHAWRDETARKEDEGVASILTNMMLATLTKLRNPTAAAINNLTKSRWPIVGRESEVIQKIFQTAKDAWQLKIDSLNTLTAKEAESDPEVSSENVSRESQVGKTIPAKSTALVDASSTTREVQHGETIQVQWRLEEEESPTATATPSKLFGSTLKSAKASPRSNGKRKSRLFGDIIAHTLNRRGFASASEKSSFADVQRDIMADLAPATQVIAIAEEPEKVSSEAHELPAVETVPFVPPAMRTTTANAATTGSIKEAAETEAPEAKPVVKLDGSPETVVVKKSKKAKKREIEALAVEGPMSNGNGETLATDGADTAAAVTSIGPLGSGQPLSKKQKKDKNKAKAKIEAKDIPVFDYSAEPNLLDNPREATAFRKKDKKNKKDKPKPVAITGTTFGKATQDKSQPKAGNMSKTFS